MCGLWAPSDGDAASTEVAVAGIRFRGFNSRVWNREKAGGGEGVTVRLSGRGGRASGYGDGEGFSGRGLVHGHGYGFGGLVGLGGRRGCRGQWLYLLGESRPTGVRSIIITVPSPGRLDALDKTSRPWLGIVSVVAEPCS